MSTDAGLLTRRDSLAHMATGLGGVALAALLGRDGALADAPPAADLNGGLHHRAKVRRVIQLFMTGGASQCDLFDYKPLLAERHGQPFDPGGGARVEASVSVPGSVMKSPFEWAQYGESGRWVSSVFPETAKHVDDLAFLMAMTSKSNVHGPAAYLQTTGFSLPGFPCLGAWISYGLGSLTEDLPAFVVLPDARGLPYNGRSAFTSGFLSMSHQGLAVRASAPQPITHLRPPAWADHVTSESRADGLALLNQLNAAHLADRPGDDRLHARIESYELAARLQTAAPDLLELAGETEATRRSYGLEDPATEGYGRNCLLARRLIERGVRFVQVWCGQGGGASNWDNHGDIAKELSFIARMSDGPTAALIADLKARGLFEDTLLVWTTEFGRMPFAQGSVGRDHNGGTFVSWFAGAGVRAGTAHGESDEWSWKAIRDATTTYDFHATILHLLGIDHERLTFYHNGTRRRLTDVHGRVIGTVLS
jgi:hypothetical protein